VSSIREKVTITHKNRIYTFDQYVEGESVAEFYGRVRCSIDMAPGDEYYEWTQRGHYYRGPVTENVLGYKRRYVQVGRIESLPGLYLRRGKKVYDYREAP
jgi:hypothetical protein